MYAPQTTKELMARASGQMRICTPHNNFPFPKLNCARICLFSTFILLTKMRLAKRMNAYAPLVFFAWLYLATLFI